MSLINILRLNGKKNLNKLLINDQFGIVNTRIMSNVSMKTVPIPEPSKLGYDERNMKLGRPLSPHLTIYNPQMTSMLSISHRFSGWALTAYAAGLGIGALVLPSSIPHYIDALQVGSVCLFSIKFTLAMPVTYHTVNGIRHLLWDLGKFFKLKQVYTTGYIMLAASIGSAIVLAAL